MQIPTSHLPLLFWCYFNWHWGHVETTLRHCHKNFETTLKRHCATLKNGCIDVVQRWFNVLSKLDTDTVSMLCDIENQISDFVSFSTLDQRYLNGGLQCWNKIIPTLKCWLDRIYEKVNSKEYSACKFTSKMKLVGIFQGLC